MILFDDFNLNYDQTIEIMEDILKKLEGNSLNSESKQSAENLQVIIEERKAAEKLRKDKELANIAEEQILREKAEAEKRYMEKIAQAAAKINQAKWDLIQKYNEDAQQKIKTMEDQVKADDVKYKEQEQDIADRLNVANQNFENIRKEYKKFNNGFLRDNDLYKNNGNMFQTPKKIETKICLRPRFRIQISKMIEEIRSLRDSTLTSKMREEIRSLRDLILTSKMTEEIRSWRGIIPRVRM